MTDRDRSRSPLRPPASPIVVSNLNAEEMDGTEHGGASRPTERREVRPGEVRRAEIGRLRAIADRADTDFRVDFRTLRQQLLQEQRELHERDRLERQLHPAAHSLQPRQPAAARRGGGETQQRMGGNGVLQVMGPVHAVSSGAPPVTGQGTPVSRLDWYEYTIARTSTVATLNAANAILRALSAFVTAAPDAPQADANAERTRAAAAETQVPWYLEPQQAPEPRPATPTPPGVAPEAQLAAISRARIGASEKLKTIAAALSERPPTRTAVPHEAKAEAIERIRAEIALIPDRTERDEAGIMLDRILEPGSLQNVCSMYAQLPAWEENAPPPPGWPFRLPGQRASLQERRPAAVDSLPRPQTTRREQRRRGNALRRTRLDEAHEAARDLFEELVSSGVLNATGNGTAVPRLPRIAPSLLHTYEMIQLRDLPAMLNAAQTVRPPEARIEEIEEQVVPTGPSMRSTHVVPVITSQARLRESAEVEYRRRMGAMMSDRAERLAAERRRADEAARAAIERGERQQARGVSGGASPRASPSPTRPERPTDTPHPGLVVRSMGEQGPAPPRSPLALASYPVLMTPEEMTRYVQRYVRRGRGLVGPSFSDNPRRRRMHADNQPASPSDSTASNAGDISDREDPEEDILPGPSRQTASQQPPPVLGHTPQPNTVKVHKLRPRTYRGPGQKKECNGFVGARRLILEHKELQTKGGVGRVEAAPKPENVRVWTAVVEGAEGSQYEGGIFFFDIHFPQQYPMGQIKIACLTHIVHPFVFKSGIVDVEAVAKLNFGVERFADMKYGGVERSLMIVAALVSGKLPEDTPEKRKQWIERGRLFTNRYAC